MENKANSTLAESEIKNDAIDCGEESKIIPQIKFDSESKTFHAEINIPGFGDDEIDVSTNEGKITINAVSKKEIQNFNLCKIHKVSFNLPPNHLAIELEKVLEMGELKLKGTLVDQSSNEKQPEKNEKE